MQNQNFWETNSKILRERYPGLLEKITLEDQDVSCEDIEIETNASGEPVLKMKGLYVHSPRDPAKEGRRLAESVVREKASSSVFVVLGFALGYAAQALAELEPQSPVVIVEKYPALLRLAFELRNLETLLSRNKLAFVLEENGINAALSLFEKGSGEKLKVEILRNRPLTGIDERWYASVENKLRAWAMKDDVNSATLQKFGKRWVRNIVKNLSSIRDLPGISRFAGLADSGGAPPLPVFIAAAGPGLDKVISLLPEIRRRCLIVAVDTSLRFLLRNAVEPDFALIIDPQFWNSRHLDRCVSPNTRLIIESAVYPPVLRLGFRRMYLCGSLFPLGKFIEERVDPKGTLATGGSVATSAWDFSRQLGARQIWIAGLDLAFPGNKTHYRGAQFEEKALAESWRLWPPESWLARAMRDGIPCTGPALGGGTVPSDRRLSIYAAWFENCFSQYPEIKNFSLSGGGLAMAGLEAVDSDALLALPDRRKEIEARLEALSGIEADFFEPQESQRRSRRYENALAALRSSLEQIKTACAKGERIASQALRKSPDPGDQEKILAALDTITRQISSSEVKEIAGFLFPRHDSEETARKEPDVKEAFINHMESLVKLYRSLMEAAQAIEF